MSYKLNKIQTMDNQEENYFKKTYDDISIEVKSANMLSVERN